MTDQPRPQRLPDPLAERLQSRLEHFEARPELTSAAARHGRLAPAAAPHPDSSADSAAAIDDLNTQLDLLRHQLDAAFDDVDARITAANAQADAADSRAQIAAAQAANVLTAVEELAAELARLAEGASREDVRGLRAAVDRVRSRLQPT